MRRHQLRSRADLSLAAPSSFKDMLGGPLLSGLRNRLDVGRSLVLSVLSLDEYLFVDENTLRSMSICSSDPHAFVHAKAGREGFTVLGELYTRQFRWRDRC